MGAIALGVLVLIVFFVTRSPGGGSNVAARQPTAGTTTTTRTTTPPQLVVTAATWQLPSAVSRAVAVAAGTRLRILGGLGPGNVTSGTVWEVDPATGQSEKLAVLANPVHDASGATIGTTSFVFGGGAATESASVQAVTVDAANKASVSVVALMPAKRADSATVSVSDQVVVVGGFDGAHWVPSVLSTTDGKAFTTLAQLPTPVRYPAVAALNDKVYVIGGEVAPNEADTTAVQMIDLQTHAITPAGALQAALSHASAAVLNGTLYVFGGRSGGHATDVISTFDPATGQLHTVGHLPAPTSDMAVTTVGDTVYLVGGEGDNRRPVTSVVIARVTGG